MTSPTAFGAPGGPGAPGVPDVHAGSGRLPRKLPLTRGRQAALVFGVPVVLVIIAATSLSLATQAGKGSYPVSFSVPLQAGRLDLSLGGGDATLRGSAGPAVAARVTGTVSYKLERPVLSHDAGNVSLGCPSLNMGNCALTAAVDVPRRAALTVSTGGGDLSASGLDGPGTLATDGGDLTVSGATGSLMLESGGGDLRADHVSGATVALTADGGNIAGSGMTSPDVTASGGGGDVSLTFAQPPRDVQVTADGGNVTIIVPPGNYTVATTSDGGTVTNQIPPPSGIPSGIINVHSGGGDITLSEG